MRLRLRLTALYGGLFLLSGIALLSITYLLVDGLPLLSELRDHSANAC